MRIVLASASPRRRELLSAIVSDFTVSSCDIDEAEHLVPPLEEGVQDAARAKAREVLRQHPDALVIGADTIVVVDQHVLGKPSGPDDARKMLRSLSGREHRVLTGVALVRDGEAVSACESTSVWFAPLSEEQIEAYLCTGEPFDKAGAYGIQGSASLFIERVDGCYFNVVGLPLFRLGVLLRQMGVEPWREWTGVEQEAGG